MRLLTLKSVLVATDLEGGSQSALRTASRLASLTGAELHLLHVEEQQTSDGVVRLRQQFNRAVPNGPDFTTVQILPGRPSEVIVTEAARLRADAIVLGPHLRRSDASGPMGSTAAKVVRTAPCPCLVAATDLRLPLERVLTAVDLSGAAYGTLAVAATWASALRPRWSRVDLTAMHIAPETAPETIAEDLHLEVERARQHAGPAARIEIHERVTPGSDPAATILQEISSQPPDLLVLGARGRVDETEGLGSVSSAVARETSCPLLLVPPGLTTSLQEDDGPA